MDWELKRGFEESNSVINSLVSALCVLGLGIVLLLDEEDGFLDPRENENPFMVIATHACVYIGVYVLHEKLKIYVRKTVWKTVWLVCDHGYMLSAEIFVFWEILIGLVGVFVGVVHHYH